MRCPLRRSQTTIPIKTVFDKDATGTDDEFRECLYEDCAWYVEEGNACAIHILGYNATME